MHIGYVIHDLRITDHVASRQDAKCKPTNTLQAT